MPCYLTNIADPSHRIAISDNEPTFVGRDENTKISLLSCSRRQVRLMVSTGSRYVLVKPIGVNNSTVLNGFRLDKHQVYDAADGDVLEIIHGHPFRITFEGRRSEEAKGTKRSLFVGASPESDSNPPKRAVVLPMAAAETTTWESVCQGQLYVLTCEGVVASERIAAYDIDGTIIKTRSGRVFPRDIDDWQLAYPEIPGKLKDCIKRGIKVVFMTNQSSIGKGKLKPEDFKTKLKRIIAKLNVPVQVFVATGTNRYRKPMTGMWDDLEKNRNGGVKVDRCRSFYVGDAAGRPQGSVSSTFKKDHSTCDRLLALNLGVPFFTPEEHFQGAKVASWVRPEFDPLTFSESEHVLSPSTATMHRDDGQEMIVLVGSPGSGKSSFAIHFYHKHPKYSIVNRDTLGSWQKCVQEAERALSQGRSVVVDNTNPDAESRKRYIDLAKKKNLSIRCFVMKTTYKHCKHNIRFREIINPSLPVINEMVLNSFKSKYQEPDRKEGFDDVVHVNFKLQPFPNEHHEQFYKSYLLES